MLSALGFHPPCLHKMWAPEILKALANITPQAGPKGLRNPMALRQASERTGGHPLRKYLEPNGRPHRPGSGVGPKQFWGPQ